MEDLDTYRARIGLYVNRPSSSDHFLSRHMCPRQKKICPAKTACKGVSRPVLKAVFKSDAFHGMYWSLILLHCICWMPLLNCSFTFKLEASVHFETRQMVQTEFSMFSATQGTSYSNVSDCEFDCLLGNAGAHCYNGNPRTPDGEKQSTFNTFRIDLADKLHQYFDKNKASWDRFKSLLKIKTKIPIDDINGAETTYAICDLLVEHGEMKPGYYSALRQCLAGNECLTILQEFENKMESLTTEYDAANPITIANAFGDFQGRALECDDVQTRNVTLEMPISDTVGTMQSENLILADIPTDDRALPWPPTRNKESPALDDEQNDIGVETIANTCGNSQMQDLPFGDIFKDNGSELMLATSVPGANQIGTPVLAEGTNAITVQPITTTSTVRVKKVNFNMQCNIQAENVAIGRECRIDSKEPKESTKFSDEKAIDVSQRAIVIDQTKSWISGERQTRPNVLGKAFDKAKKILTNKKCLVIRGNSGTGKSHLAVELLHWLSQGDNNALVSEKEPLFLRDLKTWDKTVTAKSNLAILIDDLFGYGSDSERDMNWWKKNENVMGALLEGTMSEQANCVIITLRNDLYNENKSVFAEQRVFNPDHIVDLSSPEYNIENEKKLILNEFISQLSGFKPFSDTEESEILNSSSNLGFPECCRLFVSTPGLPEERAKYFHHPLNFIQTVVKERFNDKKQKALLYLFFLNGNVASASLDVKSEIVCESLVAKVFSVHLKSDQHLPYGDLSWKLKYVREGLDSLCGSFVRKDNDVYRFFHDSVCDAVAILYGEVSPIGFLENCNSNCLHYLVTRQCDNTSCKVLIEETIFSYLYKRVIQEIESNDANKYSIVASLKPWNDSEFLSGFFEWMDKMKSIPQDFHFRNTWENPHSFFVHVAKLNNRNFLEMLLKRSENQLQMKLALDESLSAGSLECALLLLDKGVKPDFSSCFCAVEGGKIELLEKLVPHDIILQAKAERSKSWYIASGINVLHEACLLQRVDMVTLLLKKYPSLSYERSKEGLSTLHLIAGTGNVSVYKIVEESILNSKHEMGSQYLATSLRDMFNCNMLHRACLSGSSEMCEYVYNKFPTLLSQRDKNGLHCLHYTAWSGDVQCFMYIESLVWKDNTEQRRNEMASTIMDVEKRNTLHWACQYGRTKLCEYLCDTYPILLSQRDRYGLHCLHYAAVSGDVKCYKYIESVVWEGKTDQCRHDMETKMIDNISKINVLHTACVSGSTKMCEYLYTNFPSLLSKKNITGWHCLHHTAWSGDVKCYLYIESIYMKEHKLKSNTNYIQTLSTNSGESVLDVALSSAEKNGRDTKKLCDYLIKSSMFLQT